MCWHSAWLCEKSRNKNGQSSKKEKKFSVIFKELKWELQLGELKFKCLAVRLICMNMQEKNFDTFKILYEHCLRYLRD